jgi:hypothetical protein
MLRILSSKKLQELLEEFMLYWGLVVKNRRLYFKNKVLQETKTNMPFILVAVRVVRPDTSSQETEGISNEGAIEGKRKEAE